MDCEFCKKTFSTKGSLSLHQKTAKYCLELQGKSLENLFTCSHCSKGFTLQSTLNDHFSVCKEKKKIDNMEKENKIKKEYQLEHKRLQKKYEKMIKDMEEKITEKDRENQHMIEKTKQQLQSLTEEKDSYYEEKLAEKDRHYISLLTEKDKHISKLEDTIKIKDKSIMDIAFAKTGRTLNNTNTTNNITVNNNYTINLNDIDRLNQVIERHMTQSVIRGGIPSFTRMLRKNYLSSPEGVLAYKCTDIARQKFELIDQNGNRVEDARADDLREALEKSNLEEKTKRTAKEAWTRPDGTCNNDLFNQLAVKAQEIVAITEQEGDCNTKFRSELAVQASKYKK
jgi:hypothetical protein